MKERLYVDGVLCDVANDGGITVDVVSNIFTGVDKIKGNSTYTIKLPRTVNNMKVFGYADHVDCRNSMPYRRHDARYYRGGVEIFSGADASLVAASSEGYEITVVYGVQPKFMALKEKGFGLRDLASQAVVLFLEQPTFTPYGDFVAQGYGYALINTIWRNDEQPTEWTGSARWGTWTNGELEWDALSGGSSAANGDVDVNPPGRTFLSSRLVHPSVSVAWILEQIRQDTGVEFRWSGDAKQMIDSLVLPLVEKKANGLSFNDEERNVMTVSTLPNSWNSRMSFYFNANGSVFGNVSGTATEAHVLVSCNLMVEANFILKHNYHEIFEAREWEDETMEYRSHFASSVLVVKVTHTNNENDEYRIGSAKNYFVGNLWGTGKGFAEGLSSRGIISVEAGDVIQLVLKTAGGYYTTSHTPACTGVVSMSPTVGDEVAYGAKFPIVENLPDIKVIDFVKCLCVLTGTFPIQNSESNVIEFAEYDDVMNNVESAVDWSKRLVPASSANVPSKVSYKVEGWARHNYYRWKEDEKTHGKFDGDLMIDDEMLEEERDVIVFPFAASDRYRIGIMMIPLYERKTVIDDGGVERTEYDYGKTEPRILQSYGSSGTYTQTKFDMNMQNIIMEKYGLLSSCLSHAKVVEESVMLTDYELSRFDERVPVWLAQYGSYFAVLEIKSGGDGVCKVKMIKINMED